METLHLIREPAKERSRLNKREIRADNNREITADNGDIQPSATKNMYFVCTSPLNLN